MNATSAPRLVNSWTNARPRPAVPPVMATRLPANCRMQISRDWLRCKVKVKVSLKSSTGHCYPRPHAGRIDHHGDFPAQRRCLVRLALLRRARLDPVAARGVGAPALSARGVAADCLHCVCPENGAVIG